MTCNSDEVISFPSPCFLNLLNLPTVPLENVFKLMDPVDLCSLSLSSRLVKNKTRRIIGKENFDFCRVEFGDEFIVEIGRNEQSKWKWAFPTGDQLRIAVEKLSEGYGCPITHLVLKQSGTITICLQSIFNWINDFQSSTDNYRFEFGPICEENGRILLKNCDAKRKVYLSMNLDRSNWPIGYFQSYKSEYLHLHKAAAFDVLSIIHSTTSTFILDNPNPYHGETIMSGIVRCWLKEKIPNLEVVSFGNLWRFIPNRCHYSYTREVPSTTKRVFTNKLGTFSCEITGGYDIQREDGHIATLFHVERRLTLVVW